MSSVTTEIPPSAPGQIYCAPTAEPVSMVDTVGKARRGLAIYLACLVVGSATVEFAMLRSGAPIGAQGALVALLMWIPALASVIARLVLCEGLHDVSLRLGGRSGFKPLVIGWGFPVVVGLAAYLVVLGGLLGLPMALVLFLFTGGPTAAAVIISALVDGRNGLRRWLHHIVLWRVGLRWYLVALLGIPLVILLATLIMPGARVSFQPMSPVRFLVTYLIVFALAGVPRGALFEEPGWRGFALPRMQVQSDPLGGTLLLGVLWSIWHLPQYVIAPVWAAESGGLSPTNVGVFLLMVLALVPIRTWLFNHTQGSVLLATLAHASVNTAQLVVVNQLFPSAANENVDLLLAFAVVALVLIVVTHGRLGYREGKVEVPSLSGT